MDSSATLSGDRRVRRTRAALVSAFNELMFARGYDGFGVAEIAEKADVGRSTFYGHYQGKDDLLGASMGPLLDALAGAVEAEPDPVLINVIEHFWTNRRLARALLAGPARTVITRELAARITVRLSARKTTGSTAALPPTLTAERLARSQLGLIDAWLAGPTHCPPERLARGLWAASSASAAALG